MTYFRVISAEDVSFSGHQCGEDDLFSGYQRRRLLMFGLSARQMTDFQVISVEHDLFLGYQRRR